MFSAITGFLFAVLAICGVSAPDISLLQLSHPTIDSTLTRSSPVYSRSTMPQSVVLYPWSYYYVIIEPPDTWDAAWSSPSFLFWVFVALLRLPSSGFCKLISSFYSPHKDALTVVELIGCWSFLFSPFPFPPPFYTPSIAPSSPPNFPQMENFSSFYFATTRR